MITKEKAAKVLGLTEEQFETLGKAADAVYQHIGGDIAGMSGRKDGLWKRRSLIEIVFDASRVELELTGRGMGYTKSPYPDGTLIAEKIRGNPDKIQKAMPYHFPDSLYE